MSQLCLIQKWEDFLCSHIFSFFSSLLYNYIRKRNWRTKRHQLGMTERISWKRKIDLGKFKSIIKRLFGFLHWTYVNKNIYETLLKLYSLQFKITYNRHRFRWKKERRLFCAKIRINEYKIIEQSWLLACHHIFYDINRTIDI